MSSLLPHIWRTYNKAPEEEAKESICSKIYASHLPMGSTTVFDKQLRKSYQTWQSPVQLGFYYVDICRPWLKVLKLWSPMRELLASMFSFCSWYLLRTSDIFPWYVLNVLIECLLDFLMCLQIKSERRHNTCTWSSHIESPIQTVHYYMSKYSNC